MRKNRVPKYTLHKGSGQARVRLDGKDHYLGVHGSDESKRRYRELIDQWERKRDTSRYPEMSVAQLSLLYLEHCREYYVRDGKVTSEVACIRAALRALIAKFRRLPIGDFSPVKLRIVRDDIVASGVCRKVVNRSIRRIVRMFKWAASVEYVSALVFDSLRTLEGLRAGRTTAPDHPKVEPANVRDVFAVKPHVRPPVWGAIRFQMLTGARPSEALSLRLCDLDMSDKVWTFTPASHKGAHHGKQRIILVGPKAQKVVREFEGTNLAEYLFAVDGSDGRRRYRRDSYTLAIKRACAEHNIPHWTPHQLRHLAATEIRKAGDVEIAKTILGHSELSTTEIYAERNLAAARKVMAKIG